MPNLTIKLKAPDGTIVTFCEDKEVSDVVDAIGIIDPLQVACIQAGMEDAIVWSITAGNAKSVCEALEFED